MRNEFPISARHFRIDLADAAFPVKILPRFPVTPESIDVHHRKRGVALRGDLDLHGMAMIMNEVVMVEKILPA